jgi:hypothetical protein
LDLRERARRTVLAHCKSSPARELARLARVARLHLHARLEPPGRAVGAGRGTGPHRGVLAGRANQARRLRTQALELAAKAGRARVRRAGAQVSPGRTRRALGHPRRGRVRSGAARRAKALPFTRLCSVYAALPAGGRAVVDVPKFPGVAQVAKLSALLGCEPAKRAEFAGRLQGLARLKLILSLHAQHARREPTAGLVRAYAACLALDARHARLIASRRAVIADAFAHTRLEGSSRAGVTRVRACLRRVQAYRADPRRVCA